MTLLENNWGKVRCTECDSVMKIDKSDINPHEDGWYVLCPVCGSRIWFNECNPVMTGIYSNLPIHK